MHDDVPLSTPRLDPAGIDEAELQRAVDMFDTATIQGLDEAEYAITVVGVDIVPGIVVRQGDRLEAPVTIYLDLKAGQQKMSKSRRGIVEFRSEDDGITVDRVVAG